MISGTGTGADMKGLMHGDNSTAFVGGASGDTPIDTIRRARTALELNEHRGDVVILHPGDAEEIDLERGTDGQFVLTGPGGNGEERLWTLPIHISTAMTQGQFIVAALAESAALWMREDANVQIGFTDDDFTRN